MDDQGCSCSVIDLCVFTPAFSELPQPVNLTLDSSNLHHMLTWQPGPETPPGVHYSVTVITDRWVDVSALFIHSRTCLCDCLFSFCCFPPLWLQGNILEVGVRLRACLRSTGLQSDRRLPWTEGNVLSQGDSKAGRTGLTATHPPRIYTHQRQ